MVLQMTRQSTVLSAPLRLATAADWPALEALYRAVFPAEDLVPLVRDLLGEPSCVLSLVVAGAGGGDCSIAGHVAFTRCSVEATGANVALLGPLAVAVSERRKGHARRLVGEGVAMLAREGVTCVLVLGDPRFYARFGFATETRITPPYPLVPEWRDAWQSLRIGSSEEATSSGMLSVPPPWRRRELWSP